MKIATLFKSKKPVISFEIFPPKRDAGIKNIDETLEILSGLNPDFISVTFGAGGSCTNNLTVELAKKIKHQYHIEPLVHLTCINHSKSEIYEIINQLKEADIKNILALRGDRNPQIEPKEDFRHASDLARFVNNNGNFSICGACYPESHIESKNILEDITFLKEKVDNGVEYFISQLFFDNELFYSFQNNMKSEGMDIPVAAGIMPVINKSQIERMVTLCGASLPKKLIRIMQKYENDKDALFDAAIAYAVNQVKDLLSHDVDGIHLFTMNNPIVAKRISNEIKKLF